MRLLLVIWILHKVEILPLGPAEAEGNAARRLFIKIQQEAGSVRG